MIFSKKLKQIYNRVKLKTKMKTLQISQKEALKLYPSASKEIKAIFEDTFGKDFFSQSITDRISSWQDVLDTLGIREIDFIPYKSPSTAEEKSINALTKLLKIAEVYNEGWKPNWKNSNEYKYYAYKYFSDGRFAAGVGVYGCTVDDPSGLHFKTRQLAEDAINKFSDFYDEFLMIN